MSVPGDAAPRAHGAPVCLAVAVIVVILPGASAASGARCAPCHADHVQSFAGTAMGRSIGRPTVPRPARFTHDASGARYEVLATGDRMIHRVVWRETPAEYAIDYAIGSGSAGQSFLHLRGGRLFQSPVSYYTALASFRISPGYQGRRVPDFERIITADCLTCHAAGPEPPGGLAPIDCRRCHGDPAAHLLRPTAANIVNPARLPPPARDSVCEQCHLGGGARVPSPGKRFADFRPGDVLESVFTVYVDAEKPAGAGRVAGHTEELASSRCRRAGNGTMWCGTCHDPHPRAPRSARAYDAVCRSCHPPAHGAHFGADRDCVGCHMPRRAPADVPHTAFTDHRILARPDNHAAPRALRRLQPWRPPAPGLANRNLGLAYIGAWERLESPELLDQAYGLLSRSRPEHPNDPALLTALGSVLLRREAAAEALACFQEASRRDRSARGLLHLAVALEANRRPRDAIEHLERALERDPLLEEAYYRLGELHFRAGRRDRARGVLAQWKAAFPQGYGALLAARRWGVAASR